MLGATQSLMYKAFQESNPERFNQGLIYMRHNERATLHDYFRDVFASLKLQGITYLSSRTITDETEYTNHIKKKSKVIEESRLDLIEAKFKLEWAEESKEISLYVFFPKLIDDYFFYLNGNKYFAVYQISDRNFYSTRNGLFLKTLLMPLGIQNKKSSFETVSGVEVTGKEYVLDFFKTKNSNFDSLKNMFYYYFIKMGVHEAINYMFNTGGVANVYLSEDIEPPEGYEAVQLRKDLFLHILMPDDGITQNYANLLCTVVSALSGIRKISSITDEAYWKKKVLNSPTANILKADKAIVSLERVLDERTKRNLKEITDPEMKQDSFGVVKWMAYNFEELYDIDTVDVYNRRLRLYEYMLYPLLIKFSDASYRILNSRNLDVKRLETVFSNIGPMFIIKRLITNELLRYSNATSTLDLFSVILRFSARGPQALGGSGSSIVLKYRGVHPSYVGNIGLNAASASDPGMTGTLVPMSKNIDKMFFEPTEGTEIFDFKDTPENAFFG